MPSRHREQRPQPAWTSTATRSPTTNSLTPCPSLTTLPMYSWPMVLRATLTLVRDVHRSAILNSYDSRTAAPIGLGSPQSRFDYSKAASCSSSGSFEPRSCPRGGCIISSSAWELELFLVSFFEPFFHGLFHFNLSSRVRQIREIQIK